jgi:hypothetical protein
LLELHDWLGQRAGIAMAHPLLDRRLVAFCHRMPLEWIGDRGVDRRGFRSALVKILPAEHHEREKSRITARPDEVDARRRQQDVVMRALNELADSRTWLHDFVNLRALAAARREVRSGPDPVGRVAAAVLATAHFKSPSP